MDGIEGEVREVKNSLLSLSNMITNFITRNEQMHQETKEALRDHKYQDLKEEKKALQNQIEDGKKRKWDIVKGVILTIVGAIVGAIVSGVAVSFFG